MKKFTLNSAGKRFPPHPSSPPRGRGGLRRGGGSPPPLPQKIKYLILTRGPGETSQARALGKYLVKKKGEVIFCLKEEKNLFFFEKDKEFRIFLTKEPGQFLKVANKEKPSVLLIFNSKIWSSCPEFLERPAFRNSLISLSLDSNWLFNKKKYPAYPPLSWADKYLVLFPKDIFELGLKENGGNFEIPQATLEKIVPVGFIPSFQKPSQKTRLKIRERYGIKRGEKLIFAYFSGFGAGHRVWAFNNLVSAVDRLRKKDYKIKTLLVSPRQDLDEKKLKKDWLLVKENLGAKEYFETLAAADLIFQHQGLATLAQGIAAQVPIIANVGLLKEEKVPRIHFWEVQPFAKAGACFLFWKTAPIKEISQKITELLYNREVIKKMRVSQKAIFEKGEEKVFRILDKLVKLDPLDPFDPLD